MGHVAAACSVKIYARGSGASVRARGAAERGRTVVHDVQDGEVRRDEDSSGSRGRCGDV